MKYVPNALSLSRIPLSVALFIFAMNEYWSWAATCMMFALITDGLDGAIARRYKLESKFGGDVLEPVCDLALSVGAVGGLYAGGVWPLWVPLALLIITALLQISHSTPFSRLKRHTFYIHPVFFVAVVYFSGFVLLGQAVDGSSWAIPLLPAYGVSWLAVVLRKKDRWMVWFRGPQPASSSS